MVEPLDAANPEASPTQVANLSQVSVDSVQAELVRMYQSAARSVTADDVSLEMSAAARLRGKRITADRSALGWVAAPEVSVSGGMLGGLRAEQVVVQGNMGVVIGETVQLENSRSGLIAAGEVHGGQIDTIVLLGNHIEGDVRTVLDGRGAALAGLVAGLGAGLILLLARLALSRDPE